MNIKRKTKLLFAFLLFSTFACAQGVTADYSFALGKVNYYIVHAKGSAKSQNDTTFYKLYRFGKTQAIAKEIKSVINKMSKEVVKTGDYAVYKNSISFYITSKKKPIVQRLYTQNEKGLLLLKTNYLNEMVPLVPGFVEEPPKSVKAVDAYSKDGLNQVDIVAEFPGGINKARQFIADNLQYPDDAQENEIEGTVRVKFVIEKNGALTNIEIVNKLGYGCDEEVIRVLKRMPKWAPAMLKGEPVRSQFTMPVSFRLQ